jgi:hypothetical protein
MKVFIGTLRGAFLIPQTRTISSVVEHLSHKRYVVGSIPIWSINNKQEWKVVKWQVMKT